MTVRHQHAWVNGVCEKCGVKAWEWVARPLRANREGERLMDDAPQWTTLWQLADLFIEDRGDGSARIRRGDWSEWVIIDRVEMQWVLDRLAEAQARGGNTG